MADDDVSSLFSFSLGKKKKGFAQEERAGERASERELPVRSATEERERESERARESVL